MDLLTLHNISKRYPPGQRVFKNVHAALQEGEFVWLTGRSGAGKSTLLRMIAGIERPSQGQILVHGTNVAELQASAMPAYRQHLGLIFQDPMLLMDRSVAANIELSLLIRGNFSRKQMNHRVDKALDRVGLAGRGNSHPSHLSGGEAARVAIARALVAGPQLILADEPTGNLDADLAHDIIDLFRQTNERGVCLIVASHDENLIAAYPGTRWSIFNEGIQVDR